jgi:hypothetical protein
MLGSFSARLNHIRSSFFIQQGWGGADTHWAFAMHFKINLIILQSTSESQIVQYQFIATGPNTLFVDTISCVVGAYIGNNHYNVITTIN